MKHNFVYSFSISIYYSVVHRKESRREIDAPHDISPKTPRQEATKDFVLIDLTHTADSGASFYKSIKMDAVDADIEVRVIPLRSDGIYIKLFYEITTIISREEKKPQH